MDDLFLGVDGGGTRCRARLRDRAGRRLGEAEGGLANIYQDFDLALDSIATTAAAAIAAAGLPPEAIGRCCAGLGLAGVTDAFRAQAVVEAGLPFASVVVDSDAAIACIGAHGGRDGGIVIAGTGSAAFALRDGRRHAIGGRGFALGDDGSGAVIGRAALHHAVLVGDRLAPTSSLAERLLARFDDLPAIVEWSRTALSRDYGAFAPAVFEAAREGDAVAGRILDEAAAALSAMAENLLGFGVDRIALIGSVAAELADRLSPTARAALAAPISDPLDGAIRMAGGPVEGFAVTGPIGGLAS